MFFLLKKGNGVAIVGQPDKEYVRLNYRRMEGVINECNMQAAAYTVFGATAAAVQGSTIAITGEKSFQWMKLCNRFTRFCFQIGGALICGYVAAVLMAITASISAYSLFQFYSPKRFLMLKPEWSMLIIFSQMWLYYHYTFGSAF